LLEGLADVARESKDVEPLAVRVEAADQRRLLLRRSLLRGGLCLLAGGHRLLPSSCCPYWQQTHHGARLAARKPLELLTPRCLQAVRAEVSPGPPAPTAWCRR